MPRALSDGGAAAGSHATVIKEEWGAKRACPKCNTRFYDLGNADPVSCIACGNAWVPEPILKSKQTQLFEPAKAVVKAEAEGDSDDDLDIDAAEDAEVPGDDLGDDDEDLNTVVAGSDEEER